MKRILSVLLCLTIIFALVGCSGEKPQNNDQGTNSSTGSSVSSDATSSDNSSTGSNTSSNTSTNTSTNTSSNTSSNISSNTSSNTSSGIGSGIKVFKLTRAKGVTSFVDPRVVVLCWGDSITQGMAMAPGYTYPQHLQDGIGSQYRVLNAGVPGESSEAILSRANAVEICLTKNVTFAKGERKSAMDYKMFKLVGAAAPLTYRGFGNQLALSDVIIDGVSYTIEHEKGESFDKSIFYLTRKDTSTALTIRAGAKVKFNYSPQYDKVQCNVILIGANDGDQSAQSLINKYKKLIALNENYIAIVPFYGPDYSKEFKAAFGDKALNIREYFIKRAHIDYDVDLSAKDEGLVAQGRIPSMYFYKENENDCHLNEKGYKVLGDQVYKKGAELGYWK